MQLQLTPCPLGWQAVDDDTYDGAPDSKCRQMGIGKTKEEAVQDLIRQLVDDGIYKEEDYDESKPWRYI